MATHEFLCEVCGAHHGWIISNSPPPPTKKLCNKCERKAEKMTEDLTKRELEIFRAAVMESVDKKQWSKICERFLRKLG